MYDDNLADDYGQDAYGASAAAPQWNQWGLPPNSNQPAGTMDLSYWISRGIQPGAIFDENGQLRTGWKRTAKGYEQTGGGTTPQTPTNDYPITPPTGGDYHLPGDGNQFGPSPKLRSLDSLWPAWNPPSFSGPAKQFAYADYVPPSMQDAENEPGYAFASTQGRKAVEATKAAQGVYRSGQTLKDIYSWASEFAKQNYSGVFDRSLRTYGTNRDNAADSYMTNYGISRDVFDRGYNSYLGGQQGLREKAKLDFGRDWDVYAKDIDVKTNLMNGGND